MTEKTAHQLTVNQHQRGQHTVRTYQRQVHLQTIQFTCQRCGQTAFVTQYPGRSPLHCTSCRSVVRREQTAERVRSKRRRDHEGDAHLSNRPEPVLLPRSPAAIWQITLGELQLQLPRDMFDTWLRRTQFVRCEGATYTIGVPNSYARDWLEFRLRKVITRTLTQVAGEPAEIVVVLWDAND